MPTLIETKTKLKDEFYQQDFLNVQQASAWIDSFLDVNCKEVFEKAERYTVLGNKVKMTDDKPTAAPFYNRLGRILAKEFNII